MAALTKTQDSQAPGPFLLRKLEEGAFVFRLSVLSIDGSAVFIDQWKAHLGFDELRDAIEERANKHAALGSTIQNFMLEAWDADKASLGFDVFQVTADPLPNLHRVLTSEPANEAGVLAQTMRLNENLTKGLMAMAGHVNNSSGEMKAAYQDMIKNLSARAEAGDKARLETFEILDQLVRRKAEQDLEVAKLEHAQKLKEKALEKVGTLLPVVMDHVIGKTPSGANAAAIAMARTLFESVRSEQLGKFLEVLDAEQRIVALRLFKSLSDAQESKDDATTQH